MTVPPWASTIPATIARPRPAPPLPRSRPPSARQKRSNSASGSSPGRPRPWSRTSSRDRRRRRRTTSIGVPAGVCTSALRSRLASTWRSWSASPVTRAGLGVQRDLAVGRGDARVVDGVAGERGEVDRAVRRGADLVEPRERQQVLDQHAHARGLVLDPPHRLGDVLVRARRAHPVELGVAADRDQRRAQLVRRVGDEAAQPLLARLARGERVLEPVEHAVQRDARAGRPRCAGRSSRRGARGRRRRSRPPCGPSGRAAAGRRARRPARSRRRARARRRSRCPRRAAAARAPRWWRSIEIAATVVAAVAAVARRARGSRRRRRRPSRLATGARPAGRASSPLSSGPRNSPSSTSPDASRSWP